MSAYLLLCAIREHLEPRLAEFPLAVHGRQGDAIPRDPEGGEPMRPARVYVGSMPPTTGEAMSAAPFIVLQVLEGSDSSDGLETIDVALRLCIVADDYEAAENDLLNLLAQLRLWLMESPGGCVGNGRYRLVPRGESEARLAWERPDAQVPPFLQAHILTRWQCLAPRMRPSPGMVDYE